MASNYTQHVQLPLWEPDDDFLREEFNEAHQKIDRILDQATTIERLGVIETTDGYSQNIDCSELPLDRYRKLVIEGLVSYQSSGNTNLYMTMNHVKEENVYSGVSGETRLFLGGINTTPTLLRLDLYLDEEFPYGYSTTMYCWGGGANTTGPRLFRVLSDRIKTAELTSLQLESVGSVIPFVSGGRFRIYGSRV